MMTKWRYLLALMLSLLLLACSHEQESTLTPTLMAAQKQFETVEQRDLHIAEMRTNHMNLLKHKRDRTVYQGIRTPKHSLNGCIDCHVPVPTVNKTVKHTDSEHFCMTCHVELAVKIDCFQCHADRPPVSEKAVKP
ncbi:sulfur reduction protein DsrJ [Leucothrix arctica]|uniref:Sulfur reduction protein DsrJ n=1 Tax=Leucothrix arctica TaxID=1481894 RepID=A0A317CIM4_9GAMM|nr:sulfur reduction protein DsrJ [Leucothrix arctica]PWQ98346.1 sulfur reduction protein DsrJ [Leucothrix arctica]